MSDATRIVHLMRHGAPVREGLLLGRTNIAVTPAGIAACREAAATLDFRAVVTSDLARARDCAPASARVDPRWRELDFGDWDGLSPSAIDPVALQRFYDDPDGDAPPNGERWSAITARVEEAFADCAPDTLVVTHGGAMRAALALVCGLDARQSWTFHLPYAAVLSLRCWPGGTAQVIGLRT